MGQRVQVHWVLWLSGRWVLLCLNFSIRHSKPSSAIQVSHAHYSDWLTSWQQKAEQKYRLLVHQLLLLHDHLVLWHHKNNHQMASWIIPLIQGYPRFLGWGALVLCSPALKTSLSPTLTQLLMTDSSTTWQWATGAQGPLSISLTVVAQLLLACVSMIHIC